MSLRSLAFTPIAAIAVCFALAGCDDKKPEPPPPRTARVIEVIPAPLVLSAEGSGTIAAQTTTSVGFLVGGRVTVRDVDVGDTVTIGQPVASIDPTDLENQLDSAKSAGRRRPGGGRPGDPAGSRQARSPEEGLHHPGRI